MACSHFSLHISKQIGHWISLFLLHAKQKSSHFDSFESFESKINKSQSFKINIIFPFTFNF